MGLFDYFKNYNKPEPQPEPEVVDYDSNYFFYISNNDTTISAPVKVMEAIDEFYSATDNNGMEVAKEKFCRYLGECCCAYSTKQNKATALITAEFPVTNNNYDSIYINFMFDVTNLADVIGFDYTPRYWFKRR